MTMRRLGETMTRAPKTDAERETLRHVVELAHAWRGGDIDLAGVKRQCTGRERFQGMRFAEIGGADKRVLIELAEALVAGAPGAFPFAHGLLVEEELFEAGGAKAMTNRDGKRVYVWRIHSIEGDAYFPRVDLPPGEERRKHEEAASAAYRLYRDEKRKQRGRERG